MKRFKALRKEIAFEYEFEDGTVEQCRYLAPTTDQIDASMDKKGGKENVEYAKTVLFENLVAPSRERIIEEQQRIGNLYQFKSVLDTELGNLKD